MPGPSLLRYPQPMTVCPVCRRRFDTNPIPEHQRASMDLLGKRKPCEASGLDVTNAEKLPMAGVARHYFER